MKKIKLKIKNNKRFVLYKAKGFRSGFVILFAVTLSAILLSIALGVANIALKEIKFGTSGKDTNNAFFAADVGAECALYYDRSSGSAFIPSPPSITCNDNSITITENPASVWTFTVSGLGSGGQGCAKVTVDKTTGSLTQVVSNGYNNGGASCVKTSNTVERQVELNY